MNRDRDRVFDWLLRAWYAWIIYWMAVDMWHVVWSHDPMRRLFAVLAGWARDAVFLTVVFGVLPILALYVWVEVKMFYHARRLHLPAPSSHEVWAEFRRMMGKYAS